MNYNNLQNYVTAEEPQQGEQNGGLDDLRLTAEELDGIKGGCGPFHKNEPQPRTGGGGGFINNHNETVASDEHLENAPLADLEPVGEIKGGPVVLQDCLISSYQTGAYASGIAASRHTGGVNVCFGDGSVR